MKNHLDEQGKIKKLETNIKSAQSTYALAGVLALIYIARYFITGNFEFYFSSYITEFLLKASDQNVLAEPLFSFGAACGGIAVFVILYIAFGIVMLKNTIGMWLCFALYALDFAFLIIGSLTAPFGPVTEEIFIDIIVHLFVILFLTVGAFSSGKLKKIK